MIITNLLQGLIGASLFDYKILFICFHLSDMFFYYEYIVYYSDKGKEKPTNHLLSKVMDKNYYLLFPIFLFSSNPTHPYLITNNGC